MAQAVALSGRPMAGLMTVSKPRFCAAMAPTCWMLRHTVTQRRHSTHLEVSRVMAGDTSTWRGGCSPERRQEVTPRRSPRACSSQLWLRPQERQSLEWLESISS